MKDDDIEFNAETLKQFDLALLANFVHQVVNPLNGVAGTLGNLADGVIKEEDRRQQRLSAARAQLEQCISLIRNLAFFAKGFNELIDAERKIIVLPQVIIESAMFYQEDGSREGIRISLDDRETQNRASGHPGLIRQVLMNIFDNCIKYGAPNNEVEVKQWIQSNTSNAIITIRNRSRLPLRQEDLIRLCDLGFRGTNARQLIASGTGLGLYISKQIIESVHGGQFHIQTFGHDGIEFTIKLPSGERGVEKHHHG